MNSKTEGCRLCHLSDVGCGKHMTEQILRMRKDGDRTGEMKLLTKLRQTLLNRIHANQRKLDCLDFLLYQMNQNGKEL